ncbi:MAG TPA: reverse transcriptase family protein [Methylophilaceae bacterium]|jgi:hypothetical protein
MKKSYSIDQSPLYSIRGLKQLEDRLKLKLSRLEKLLRPQGYRTFRNDNDRDIQHPVGWLADVHGRIARNLAKIDTPNYVYSRKYRSYVDNAYQHTGYQPLVKTDISNFYPSTDYTKVKDMFFREFKCSKDVSAILAKICCFRQEHLPTGSAISGYIAFFANKPLFDQVQEYAISNGCTFTLYVDDLTISGPAASKRLISKVVGLIRQHGYLAKRSKTKTFAQSAVKTVTGVVIKGNRCLPQNEKLKEIVDTKVAISIENDPIVKERLKRSLKGRLLQKSQIEKINDGIDEYQLIYS